MTIQLLPRSRLLTHDTPGVFQYVVVMVVGMDLQSFLVVVALVMIMMHSHRPQYLH